MKKSPISISKLKCGLSRAAKWTNIVGLILVLHAKELSIALGFIHICSFIIVYQSKALENADFNLIPYIDISGLVQKAEKIKSDRTRIDKCGAELTKHLQDINANCAYGIITKEEKKPSTYQRIIFIGNNIALFFSSFSLGFSIIFSLLPCIISSSKFKNKMTGPFFINRCFIFLSSLIMIANIVCQAKAIDICNLIKCYMKKYDKVTKDALYIERDTLHAKRELTQSEQATFIFSNTCAIALSFASFFYLIATYKTPDILGTPIFVACANFLFVWHRYLGDEHYLRSCLIDDNITRFIVIDTPIKEVYSAKPAQYSQFEIKKLSQIHVTGTFGQLMCEFQRRFLMLAEFKNNEEECMESIDDDTIKKVSKEEQIMLQVHMTTLGLAIQYLTKFMQFYNLSPKKEINVKISREPSSAQDQITYKTKFDGSATEIIKGETSIYKFEGSENKGDISHQYVNFGNLKYLKSFFNASFALTQQSGSNSICLDNSADTGQTTNKVKGKSGAVLLTDIDYTGQATNKVNGKSEAILLTELMAILMVAKHDLSRSEHDSSRKPESHHIGNVMGDFTFTVERVGAAKETEFWNALIMLEEQDKIEPYKHNI